MNLIDMLSSELFQGLGGAQPPPMGVGGPPPPIEPQMPAMGNAGGSPQPPLPAPSPARPGGSNFIAELGKMLGGGGGPAAVMAPQLPQAAPSAMPAPRGAGPSPINGGQAAKPMPGPQSGAGSNLMSTLGAAFGLPSNGGATPGAGQPDAKPSITGKDVQAFIRSLVSGMAAVDPRQPGLTAFAQGAAGALKGRDAFEASEAARVTAAEDRAMKLDDRSFKRSTDIAGERRADAREKREGRSAEIQMVKTVSDVMKNLDPTLDVKDRIAVERLVRDEGKRLQESGVLDAQKLKTEMETYRQGLEDRLKAGKPTVGAGAAPANGASAAPAAGAGKTAQDAARPTTQQAFDALPSGAYFVNPADGRVMQKK